MAAPSSGLIRLSGIFSELNEDDYTVLGNDGETLRLSQMFDGTWGTINTNSSSYPTNVNPDKMSEFYSYDHDAAGSSYTSFSSSPMQGKNPCGYSNSALNQTYYHDGSGAHPLVNDSVYQDDEGSEALGSGQYKIGPFSGNYYRITVNNSGVVTVAANCG